jgi:hypothetical protein
MAASPAETFLSHSSRDRAFVDTLAAVLAKHSVPYWYSTTKIAGGQKWHDEIGAALKRCDWFVIVLSRNSVKSKWAKRELTYALTDDRYEDRIIPVVIDTCDVTGFSWTLASFQAIDFTSGFDSGCTDLLRTWGIAYAP